MMGTGDNLNNGSVAQDRFDLGGYRGARRDGAGEPTEPELAPRNGKTPHLEERDLRHPGMPTLPSLELDLTEPVFTPPEPWAEPSGSMVDHPLLRGLLLELPPKGCVPPPGWLDRWFEAARCILELLYLQEADRSR